MLTPIPSHQHTPIFSIFHHCSSSSTALLLLLRVLPRPTSVTVTMAPTSKTRASTRKTTSRTKTKSKSAGSRTRKTRSIRSGTCANCGCSEVSQHLPRHAGSSLAMPQLSCPISIATIHCHHIRRQPSSSFTHPTYPPSPPSRRHHTLSPHGSHHHRDTPTSGAATAAAVPARPTPTITDRCFVTPVDFG